MKIVIVGPQGEGKTRLLAKLRPVLSQFDGGLDLSIGDGQRPNQDASIQVYVTNDADDAVLFIQNVGQRD
jgi:predicted ATP-binding protein involved in virulence